MKHRKSLHLYLISSVLIFLFLSGCRLKDEKAEQEKAEIAKFISDNPTLDFVKKTSGLYYYEVETGAGLPPKTYDSAFIKHTMKLLDGDTIYTNVGTLDTLKGLVNVGWLIPGFDEGILYMREGGKSVLLLPSFLAYGIRGNNDVPGYTPILIEVNLVKIKPFPFGK